MSDEQSRLARLEERVQDVEEWVHTHEHMGEDVSLLKQCVKTYNGSIAEIRSDVKIMRDQMGEWKGSLKMLKWAFGVVGISGIASIVSVIVGLL